LRARRAACQPRHDTGGLLPVTIASHAKRRQRIRRKNPQQTTVNRPGQPAWRTSATGLGFEKIKPAYDGVIPVTYRRCGEKFPVPSFRYQDVLRETAVRHETRLDPMRRRGTDTRVPATSPGRSQGGPYQFTQTQTHTRVGGQRQNSSTHHRIVPRPFALPAAWPGTVQDH
jgi:hypothetical protein